MAGRGSTALLRVAAVTVVIAAVAAISAAASGSGSEGKILWVTGFNGDVYASNPDGTSMTRLTCYATPPSFSALVNYATWSPDGSKIAFVKSALNVNSVYVMNGDGSGQQLVADGYYPAFSPDGSKIAFNGPSADALDIAPTTGGPVTRMSYSGTVVRPTWSPGGTQIAFSNQFSIIVWNATTDSPATIYGPPPGTSWARFPAWSPDGSKIALVGSDNNIWTVDVGSGACTPTA